MRVSVQQGEPANSMPQPKGAPAGNHNRQQAQQAYSQQPHQQPSGGSSGLHVQPIMNQAYSQQHIPLTVQQPRAQNQQWNTPGRIPQVPAHGINVNQRNQKQSEHKTYQSNLHHQSNFRLPAFP